MRSVQVRKKMLYRQSAKNMDSLGNIKRSLYLGEKIARRKGRERRWRNTGLFRLEGRALGFAARKRRNLSVAHLGLGL